MAVLAEVDPSSLPMPAARARTLVLVARALVTGDVVLDPGADRNEAAARLQMLPGVGLWTANYIRMRALSDPDVFMATDLGARRALERLGQPGHPGNAAAVVERWRPWRSYALHHLWASLDSKPAGLERR
jgi:AraC family transcriptional regulator of adaptative response / DNA-3-methyladenine glycosylase II